MAKKSFYERYSKFILLAATVIFPILVYGAQKASETNRNDVKDWLPEQFVETQEYHWFQSLFENETQVIVSWPGATLDDPHVTRFSQIVAPKTPSDTSEIDTSLFSGVMTGSDVVQRLTRPPVNLDRDEAIKRLSGVLVGKDRNQVAAVVSLSPKGQADPHHTLDQIYLAAETATGLPHEQIFMGGPPVDNVAIDHEGLKTLHYLATISALLGLGLSFWCMRKWDLTLLIFATAIYSGAISLALVYFTGSSMDAILYSMPPVVYTAALSGAIHIINYYRNAVHSGGRAGAAGRGLRRAWLPCFLSAGTTAIGLFSLCSSDLVPIRSFGFYAGVGVMGTLTLLFLTVPAALELWAPKMTAPPLENPLAAANDSTWLSRLGMRCAWTVVRNNGWICAGFAITLVACGLGALSIKTSVSINNLFSPKADIVKQYTWLEDNMGGLVPMEVIVRFDNQQNHMTFLERLKLIDKIQKHLVSLDEVSSAISPATFTPDLPTDQPSRMARGVGGAMQRIVARDPNKVRRDVFNKKLEQHRDELEMGDYLSHDTKDGKNEEQWRISIRLLSMDNLDYGEFVQEIKKQVEPYLHDAEHRDLAGVSAVYTGVTPVVYKAERALLEGLVESFFMAFAIMAVAMAITFRSIPAGLLVMFPNVWPMAIVFGLLGFSGRVVDIGTMMTASVAMGVAVDDAIHYLTWFRMGIAKGYSRKDAAIYAYRNAAVPMAQSSIIVGLGLSVFGLSSFVPTQMFGLLMVTLLAWGLFADLVLMPAIVSGPLGRFFVYGVKPEVPAAQPTVTPDETNLRAAA